MAVTYCIKLFATYTCVSDLEAGLIFFFTDQNWNKKRQFDNFTNFGQYLENSIFVAVTYCIKLFATYTCVSDLEAGLG